MGSEPASISQSQTVSVVMTTYNGSLYLREQLDSILCQTLTPLEIIICDDQSSDDTLAILEKYSREHASVKYFVNEKRLGVIENFKKAASLATGSDFIALADQDDIWMPDKLALLTKKMVSVDDTLRPAMVYSDLVVIDSVGNLLNSSFWNELGQDGYQHCFDTLLFGNFVTGCTIMMNQQMRIYFGSMPSNVLMHDAWLALIAFSFGSVGQIKAPLVKYRRHDSNLAFLKTYRKKNLPQRLMNHFMLLWKKNNFLGDQLRLVTMFDQQYHHLLSKDQSRSVMLFLGLQNKSYFGKMIAFRSFFKNHWLKA